MNKSQHMVNLLNDNIKKRLATDKYEIINSITIDLNGELVVDSDKGLCSGVYKDLSKSIEETSKNICDFVLKELNYKPSNKANSKTQLVQLVTLASVLGARF